MRKTRIKFGSNPNENKEIEQIRISREPNRKKKNQIGTDSAFISRSFFRYQSTQNRKKNFTDVVLNALHRTKLRSFPSVSREPNRKYDQIRFFPGFFTGIFVLINKLQIDCKIILNCASPVIATAHPNQQLTKNSMNKAGVKEKRIKLRSNPTGNKKIDKTKFKKKTLKINKKWR